MSKNKRRFTWDIWDYDEDGNAYIIAMAECPDREQVADYIIKQDHLDPTCKLDMNIREGWCSWQIRRDWVGWDGETAGGYVIEEGATRPSYVGGRPLPGWFPVWIMRRGKQYNEYKARRRAEEKGVGK